MPKTMKELISGRRTLTTSPETTVREAAGIMAEYDIGALPVLRDGRLVGIFTERDLVTRVVAADADPATLRVGEVMTRNPCFVEPKTSLREAIQMMQQIHCRHLPVMGQGRLVGIVGLREVLPALLEQREKEIGTLEEYLEYLPSEMSAGD